jgi:hypothetical protein
LPILGEKRSWVGKRLCLLLLLDSCVLFGFFLLSLPYPAAVSRPVARARAHAPALAASAAATTSGAPPLPPLATILQIPRPPSAPTLSEQAVSLNELDHVLNVFNRRGDGYGEVLMYQPGYEGFAVRLLRFTRTGLLLTKISIGDGC